MNLKKVLVSFVTVMTFAIWVFTQNMAYATQLAEDQKVYMGAIPLMTENWGYAIGDPNTNGTEEQENAASKIWNIVRYISGDQYKNANLYCVRAGVGFTQASASGLEKRPYDLFFDMKKERESIRNQNDVLRALVETNITIGEKTVNRYDAVMALLDRLYLPGDPVEGELSEDEKATLLKERKKVVANVIDYAKTDDTYNMFVESMAKAFEKPEGVDLYDFLDELEESCTEYNLTNFALTDSDIEAVQQAAIWYFTNSDEGGKYNKIGATDWLHYTTDGNVYANLANYGTGTHEEKEGFIRNVQAEVLYHYLIEQAIGNASNYSELGADASSEPTTNSPIKIEDIELEGKEFGDKCIIGPIHITELNAIVPYSIDFAVKNNGTQISYQLLNSDKTQVTAGTTVEDLIGNDFYISVSKEQTESIEINITVNYNDSKMTLWASSTNNGEQPLVEVEKTPKSETKTLTFEPEIHKGVKTVENQDSGYDAAEEQTWVIHTTIPTTIEDYKEYKVTDGIDYRLDYISGSVIVKIGNTTLQEGTDYQLTYTGNPTGVTEKTKSGTLDLTFIDTDNGISVPEVLKENKAGTIEITFHTKFATDENGKLLAELGTEVPNHADLIYDNSFGRKTKPSENPEVHTGGISLFKYYMSNGEKVALEGAEFTIYRSQEDANSKQNGIMTATSGADGLVKFIGLKYGGDATDDENNFVAETGTYEYDSTTVSTPYWIVETKVPDNYESTLTGPLEVQINKNSYTEEMALVKYEVENTPTPKPFDLALRKYITKVEYSKDGAVKQRTFATRNPNIDTSTIETGKTATYKHRKDPVSVETGDVVTYQMTIYNEGEKAGRATKVVDQLPTGLQFNAVVSGNFEVESYDETTNRLVLKRKADNTNNLEAYTGGDLASETIEITCTVVEEVSETEETKILTNVAWIAEAIDEEGNNSGENNTDRDSQPLTHPDVNKDNMENYTGNGNKGDLKDANYYYKGQQDDDDFEKVQIIGEPEIHKGVKTIENQDSGYDATEEQTWVIHTTIPTDIDGYKEYKVTDGIDYRLDYISGSVIVKIGNTTLQEGTDYQLTYTGNPNGVTEKTSSGTLDLTFIDTDNGISVPEVLKENKAGTIEITFHTKFATDENGKLLAELGTEVPNHADLIYDNSFGRKTKPSENPEVHTGGISLFKYYMSNGEKVALEGAEFTIYGSEEDANNKQNGIMTATSGADGLVKFIGLKYGGDATDDENNFVAETGTYEYDSTTVSTPYWMVETKVPDNYESTLTGPLEVEINKDSYTEEMALVKYEVENTPTPKPFDLKLIKRIVAVNNQNVPERIESIDASKLNTLGSDEKMITTADYQLNKEPVPVKQGDIVTYTFRIYNEGYVDGYAQEITEDIPEGLQFLWSEKEGEELQADATLTNDEKEAIRFNQGYLWGKFVYDETNERIVQISSDFLSKQNETTPGGNLIKAFGENDGTKTEENLSYKELSVKFKVIAENVTGAPIRNEAAITEDCDGEGNTIDDRDSRTDVWVKYEDDEDYDNVILQSFDLALRKFIVAVGENTEIKNSDYLKNDDGSYTRAPIVDTSKLNTLDENKKLITTAIYNHTKEPVLTKPNNTVIYMLRVYNEGDVDGYASEITDYLPPYLQYVESEFNKEYGWKISEDGRTVTTRYLEDSIIGKAQTDENGKIVLSYKEVPIMCKVMENAKTNENITNIAEITEYLDDKKNPTTDRDSQANNVKVPDDKDLPAYKDSEKGAYIPGQQDDDDFEKVIVKIFDLALRKWVTQAIVIENGQQTITETGHQPYDDPEAVVKVELHRKKLNQVVVKFRYSIRVINEGEVEGYAKEITDYIPEGLKFVAEDNNGWIDEGNNVISTTLLENTLLQPGEYADVEVVLTWINSENNMGVMTNIAEISKDYNRYRIPDRDSTPDNRKYGEDDIDDAPVMLSISTGQVRIYFALGFVVLITIAGGVALIKKYILA